ncbi:patatin-like phospholipase family protein [Corallococcus silvisoli]|uniref:patatin-like phospholipase family protein n=1 Tax=Corallococcus silvisoli TaxID=2697031 RepID=UPI0022A6E8E8|nr:patatin-like phospholipase family protein [Corallococcus silvisoli]
MTPAGLKVLCLDGGGLHTLFSLRLIQRLNAMFPFLNDVDAFSGTSAGGISALILAAGDRPSERIQVAIDFWSDSRYFTLNLPQHAFSPLSTATYTNHEAKKALEALLGDVTLGQLKRQVVIPSFELDNEGRAGRPRSWAPRIFSTLSTREPNTDHKQVAVDVGLRTAASPMGFPIYEGFVDAGIYANNPSMCALAEALRGDIFEPPDIQLFSVGGGLNRRYVASEDGDWGPRQWVLDLKEPGLLLEMVFASGVEAVSFQCLQVLGEQNFFRLNPAFQDTVPMTNAWLPVIPVDLMPNVVEKLIGLADAADLSKALLWMESNWGRQPRSHQTSAQAERSRIVTDLTPP